MEEKPLVFFAEPTIADKEKRHGGGGNYHFPSHTRQIERLEPQFQSLRDAIDAGNIYFSRYAVGVEPEYTLVFETVGNPDNFYCAIQKLKKEYPTIEWIQELSDSYLDGDEDFYRESDSGNPDITKPLTTKLFCILTNQQALNEIMSLWTRFKKDETYKFPRGMTGFRNLFQALYNVHKWGLQERLEDTGLLEAWENDLQDTDLGFVKVQIELFFRSLSDKRSEIENNIRRLVKEARGDVLCSSIIPEIEYHALLVTLPREYAQKIIKDKNVELVLAESIMFLKPCTQAVFTSTEDGYWDEEPIRQPSKIINEPVIALFDGMPQANHPLLQGLLNVDDPDGYEQSYEVKDRVHGTSMASLILRGIDMSSISDEIRRIYVRPIMKAENWPGAAYESIPDDILIVDKIHEAVRRMFDSDAGNVSPKVRIINLSIGLRYREYYNMVSPLAKLLDWLSYKYRVLFIVSAGNHSEAFDLGIEYSDFKKLSDEDKTDTVIKYLSQDIRNRRLLSPAESINSLTVGATFSDNNDANPIGQFTKLSSDGMPALYGSFGTGINDAIKPDVLFPGGRNYVQEDYTRRGYVKWRTSKTKAPGISSATPGLTEGIISKAFSVGTSNATALITNKAQECYSVLEEVFAEERGMAIPDEYVAVIIKAMLAHGASWNGWDFIFAKALNLSGSQARNNLHRYLGYGEPDIEKVKRCAEERVTLIGYGDIKQGEAFVYSIPLPIEFQKRRMYRKLTTTLAYFTPIHPASVKYREKQVWLTVSKGQSLIGSRKEYDFHAVQRGTLQHEIFENEQTEVWNLDSSIELKVNCRGYASEKKPEVMIPYAILATFEMAPNSGINVYEKVVEKVKAKTAINPMSE